MTNAQPTAPARKRDLVDQRAAAEFLGGMSERTLESWRVKGGGPPFFRIGRHVRYDLADLVAFLDGRRRRSTSDPGPSDATA